MPPPSLNWPTGIVIVLNGPSVAGKTSIQKKLQERFAEPHLAMGIDSMLCGMMPPRYFAGPTPDRNEVFWGDSSMDASGAPLFTLRFGAKGRRLVGGIHRAIAAFAEQGNPVLVDYILYEREWLDDFALALRSVTSYLVGVRLPLDVLEERERRRGTSPAGHARSHYGTVHAGVPYDLEVDSSRATPDECAAAIAEYVSVNPHPSAFESVRARGAHD